LGGGALTFDKQQRPGPGLFFRGGRRGFAGERKQAGYNLAVDARPERGSHVRAWKWEKMGPSDFGRTLGRGRALMIAGRQPGASRFFAARCSHRQLTWPARLHRGNKSRGITKGLRWHPGPKKKKPWRPIARGHGPRRQAGRGVRVFLSIPGTRIAILQPRSSGGPGRPTEAGVGGLQEEESSAY